MMVDDPIWNDIKREGAITRVGLAVDHNHTVIFVQHLRIVFNERDLQDSD